MRRGHYHLYFFVGISPCWLVYDVSKLFMILLMHSGLMKSKEKLFLEPMFTRSTFAIGWFWFFSVDFLVGTVSLSGKILIRQSISRL